MGVVVEVFSSTVILGGQFWRNLRSAAEEKIFIQSLTNRKYLCISKYIWNYYTFLYRFVSLLLVNFHDTDLV